MCYTFLLVENMTDSEPEKRDLTDLPQDVVRQEDEFWMRQALAQAHLAYEQGEVPVGAVAVHKGQIIGAGFNRKESDGHFMGFAYKTLLVAIYPTDYDMLDELRQFVHSLDN